MSIVTFTQYKAVTGLAKIVDESRKFDPFVPEAEEELKGMLGETLFAELQAAITALFSGTPDLQTLFDNYVKYALSWRVYQYALRRMHHEPTANGNHTVGNGEYTSIDEKTLAGDVSQARSFADNRYKKMLKYLNENTDLFPSFQTSVDGEVRVNKVYKGGVVTKRSRWTQPYGISNTYKEGNRNQYGECCDE